MAHLSLYYHTQLETKVSLLPEQITGDIDNFILENLKQKIDSRSTENGIVIRINRLIDYDYGIIDKTHFMGTTVYKVKYECLLCSPVKDLEMICVVENIIKGFLISKNGPVYSAIQFSNIDFTTFEIVGDEIKHIATGRLIKKQDHLKVSIININNNTDEGNIMAMCKLLNFATKAEIKKFNEEQAMIEESSIGANEDVEFI